MSSRAFCDLFSGLLSNVTFSNPAFNIGFPGLNNAAAGRDSTGSGGFSGDAGYGIGSFNPGGGATALGSILKI